MRTRFQGVSNIVRFNWHFYLLSLGLILVLCFLENLKIWPFHGYLYLIGFFVLCLNIISLAVSYYVYDLSGLYGFKWLNVLKTETRIVNISAGFDETSHLLSTLFKEAEMTILDFYDPLKHTEISIIRARKAYPIFQEAQVVKTANLELDDDSADKIFVILSAHEIRDEEERVAFFEELKRVIRPAGQIFIVEHLRDTANFLAYNIGFFHFYSKSTWAKIFQRAGLKVHQELKLNPFISTFILEKNGNTF